MKIITLILSKNYQLSYDSAFELNEKINSQNHICLCTYIFKSTPYAQIEVRRHNLIVSCKFNNEPCTGKNFTIEKDPIFRNCFLFSLPAERRVVEGSGPEFGLELVLFVGIFVIFELVLF